MMLVKRTVRIVSINVSKELLNSILRTITPKTSSKLNLFFFQDEVFSSKL